MFMKKEEKYTLVAELFKLIGKYMAPFWMGLEFILYLVKDSPFNWLSVATFGIAWAMYAGCYMMVISIITNETGSDSIPKKPGKSRFQHKLEELQKSKEL